MVCELNSQKYEDDQVVIGMVDAMNMETLNSFQHFRPLDLWHYNTLQLEWIRTEVYFLGCQLGRKPTQEDIISNPTRNLNSCRFRAYYCLRFSEKVHEVPQRLEC